MKILSLTIDSSTVERVSSTKFLGGCTSQRISLDHQHMSLSRRHNSTYTFSAGWKEQVSHPPILTTFYRGTIEMCWPGCITVWYGTQQCCWPQRHSADSEHSCKDHRCPLSHPSWTFSCTMLQQNQTASWRTPPTPPTVSSSSYHQEDGYRSIRGPLRQAAQQLFPPGCESPELRSPRPPLKHHANPYPLKHGTPPHPLSNTPLTLPHKKKNCELFCSIQSVLHTGEWACTNHL